MTDIFQRNLYQKTPSNGTSLNGTHQPPVTIPPPHAPSIIETKTPYSFDSPKSSVGFQTTPVQTTTTIFPASPSIRASPSPNVYDVKISMLMQRIEKLEVKVRDVEEGVEKRIQDAFYEAVNGRDLHERRVEVERRMEQERRLEERRIEEEDDRRIEAERKDRNQGNRKVWDEEDWNQRLVDERREEENDERSQDSVVIMPERAASVCGSVIQRIEERIRETERKLR
jgi:hypothetical protein